MRNLLTLDFFLRPQVIVIFLKNPGDIVDLTDCIQELKNVNNMVILENVYSCLVSINVPFANIIQENDPVDIKPNILSSNTNAAPPLATVENISCSLENRILGELQLRNPEMVFAESECELSVNSEKKDLEKDEASGFSAEGTLILRFYLVFHRFFNALRIK